MNLYTWVMYADDEQGNKLTSDPLGKSYIGLTRNQSSPVESSNPKDYVWSPIK